MRNFVVPAILSILLLTACERIYMQPVPEADRTASQLFARAAAGDASAQLRAGLETCDTRLGVYDPDPSTALGWWKKASKSRDRFIANQAHQELAEYYLAEYPYDSYPVKEGEPTRPPGTYKKVAKCRGERPVKPDYALAEYHFKQCAGDDAQSDFGGPTASMCRHGLGHLYYLKKNYAEAFFWYLTVTAPTNIVDHPEFNKWLDSVKDYRELGFKGSRDNDYTRFAAERLSAKERAAVLKRVKAHVGREMQKRAL
ncbi:MAG: hypothetical protein ACAH80_02330 [Alphaproteobacteria bacterium]